MYVGVSVDIVNLRVSFCSCHFEVAAVFRLSKHVEGLQKKPRAKREGSPLLRSFLQGGIMTSFDILMKKIDEEEYIIVGKQSNTTEAIVINSRCRGIFTVDVGGCVRYGGVIANLLSDF